MKKSLITPTIIVLIGISTIATLYLKHTSVERKIENITTQRNYTITKQEDFDFTISIPKSTLSDNIYTSEGCEFEKDEVIVYETETTTICLEKIMLANESDDRLYFMFNYSYNLPDSGCILLPYKMTDKKYTSTNRINLRSKDITDQNTTYPEATSLRSLEHNNEFSFYVLTDVCKRAIGDIKFDVSCNKLSYVKK